MTTDAASPTALAPIAAMRLTTSYARHALFDPASITLSLVAVALAAAYVGPFGVALAAILIAGACVGVTRSRIVRRHLDRRLEARARERREAGRMRALGLAGPVQQHRYVSLREVVEQVERADPMEARRCELQELLEHYVRTVVLHHRSVAAFELASTGLASDTPPCSSHASRANEIAARRMRHRDACRQQVERLADEIEAIDQLVRLIAQRVACPPLDEDLGSEIDRRLWEVDQMTQRPSSYRHERGSERTRSSCVCARTRAGASKDHRNRDLEIRRHRHAGTMRRERRDDSPLTRVGRAAPRGHGPPMVSIDVARIDAMAFDLDGVVTKTAAVHAAAWQRLFDELLERRAAGEAWTPFDIDRDYRTFVDGKPRCDGIRSFLAARGIALPDGRPGDGPDATTVHGLAERKNGYVLAHLARAGVEVYDDAVRLIHAARARGVKRAVVTASENCDAVLAAARLAGLFEVQVDGRVAGDLGLRGKPAPDTFLEAVRRLGTSPERAIVFEDAIAGIRAARAGGFALVLGVDRTGHADELRGAGADAVVCSLDEIELRDGAEARP